MKSDFQAIFDQIRPMFAAHEDRCVVTDDGPDRYYLGSHEVRQRDGYRTAFGGVEIKKNYVSAHLMPVYLHPDLLDSISGSLQRRMQGKSCFNFTSVDDALFTELRALIDAGAERFAADGRI